MSKSILIVMTLMLLAGCAAHPDGFPDADEVLHTYRDLPSKGLFRVDGGLAMLCRATTPEDENRVHEHYGIHAFHYMRIYLNSPADRPVETGVTFPVGAIVVKEKILPPGESKALEVGGMIKRGPGFDPANGDWEYFYSEPQKPLVKGRIASCINCHRGAADTDHVFGEWARERQESTRE